MAFNISYIISVTNKFSTPLKQMSAGVKGLAANFKKAAGAGGLVDKQFGRLRNTLKNHPLLTLGGAFLVLRQGFGSLIGFRTHLNKLSAVTMATTDDMARMENVAKELGRTTAFTSSQTAQAMTFLAQAGFDTNQILKAIPGTLQLAAAGGIELAAAADIATNVLAAMGMEVKELTRVNDVFAKTQSVANTDIYELAEAYKTSATIANKLGFEVELLSATFGVLADQGIKGSNAGTQVRRMLTNMSAPTKNAVALYRKLGINMKEFVNAQGKITNFEGFIENLEQLDKKGKLSVGTLQTLFGEQGFRAAAGLITGTSKHLRELVGALEIAGGTAQEMSDRQMAGLVGTTLRLSSAYEGFTNSLLGSAETGGAISLVIRALTTLLGALTLLNDKFSWVLTPIYVFIAALVAVRIATFSFAFASTQLISVMTGVKAVMFATAAGTAAYTTAATIATAVVGSLGLAFRAMWVFATGPIGLAVVGIGLMITYVQYLKEKFGGWGPVLEMAFAPILFLLKPLTLVSRLVAKIYRNWGKMDDKTLTVEHLRPTGGSGGGVDTQTSRENVSSKWAKWHQQRVDVNVGGEIGVTASGGAAVVKNTINHRTGMSY